MNSKALSFIRNFSYTLISNLISLLISSLVILVVPKMIGIEDYGYWQLYLFYASYVGFFQFGWNDGIYLRYGGKRYFELNKNLFFSQFWMLTFFQIILSLTMIIYFSRSIIQPDKFYIAVMVSISMVIVGVRAMILFILQATNRIKDYAVITTLDRLSYCLL